MSRGGRKKRYSFIPSKEQRAAFNEARGKANKAKKAAFKKTTGALKEYVKENDYLTRDFVVDVDRMKTQAQYEKTMNEFQKATEKGYFKEKMYKERKTFIDRLQGGRYKEVDPMVQDMFKEALMNAGYKKTVDFLNRFREEIQQFYEDADEEFGNYDVEELEERLLNLTEYILYGTDKGEY